MADADTGEIRSTPRPRYRLSVPREGEDGVFSQNWYPICRSADVAAGTVIGRAFLGGKVAVYRGEDGCARVVSSYCVHMGADLSIGRVVGNAIQCPFHHWEYGAEGRCIRTGIGARPPARAQIFAFPTVERWGLIWAFNGEEALWPLPDLDRPDDDLVLLSMDCDIRNCEPYMLTANAFDWQHFGCLHDFHASEPMDEKSIRWGRHSCGFEFFGKHWLGEETHYKIEVYGTNIYLQQGTLDGRWYAMVVPMGIPAPGTSTTFVQILVPKGDGSPEALTQARYRAAAIADMEMRFVMQDQPVLNSIHFGPTFLIPEDRQFGRFIKYAQSYPRANPAQHFLV